MSIFGAIKQAIFGTRAEAAPAPSSPASPQMAPGAAAGAAVGAAVGQVAAQASAPAQAPAQQAPATEAEISARLDSIAQGKGVKSNYKTSIVDLMKLLDLDSSMTNRITLAKELGYTGDTNDSATMNIWLHKQVMASLASRGQ